MRVYDNGVYRDATPEEEAEHQRMQAEMEQLPPPAPSPEERLDRLEGLEAEMIAAYEEGVNNG